jgi:hypothetical protein
MALIVGANFVDRSGGLLDRSDSKKTFPARKVI